MHLPDRGRALAYAREVARELMNGREDQIRCWRLDVYENRSERVFELPFAARSTIRWITLIRSSGARLKSCATGAGRVGKRYRRRGSRCVNRVHCWRGLAASHTLPLSQENKLSGETRMAGAVSRLEPRIKTGQARNPILHRVLTPRERGRAIGRGRGVQVNVYDVNVEKPLSFRVER